MSFQRPSMDYPRTFLFGDLRLYVEIDPSDDHVGHDIQNAHNKEYVRIVKRNLLGQLHHHDDDRQICSV